MGAQTEKSCKHALIQALWPQLIDSQVTLYILDG
jgi:hypothetical protein